MAAQPGSSPVPLLLHGVSGGRANAGSPNQEGPEEPLEDGGQLSSVCILAVLILAGQWWSVSERVLPYVHQGQSAVWDHVLEETQLRPERTGAPERGQPT